MKNVLEQTFVGSIPYALNLCPTNTITGRPNLSSPLRYKQPKLAIERKSSFLALRSKRSYLKKIFRMNLNIYDIFLNTCTLLIIMIKYNKPLV